MRGIQKVCREKYRKPVRAYAQHKQGNPCKKGPKPVDGFKQEEKKDLDKNKNYKRE
jgi:hypothetical protein